MQIVGCEVRSAAEGFESPVVFPGAAGAFWARPAMN
jgi:hypothetical protein